MVMTKALLDKLEQKRAEKLLTPLKTSLQEYAPKECRVMSKKHLNEFLHRCYRNAQKEGCQTYGELKAFTIIAFHLGVDFHQDPLYPKIYQAFQEERYFEMKVNQTSCLFLTTYYPYSKEQLKAYKVCLDKLSQVNFAIIKTITDYQELPYHIERLYPQKVKQLGGVKNLQKIFPHYQEQLTTYQLNTPVGNFLFYLLLILLGSSMIDDPRYHRLRSFWYRYADNEYSKTEMFKTFLQKRLRKEIKKVAKQLKEKTQCF